MRGFLIGVGVTLALSSYAFAEDQCPLQRDEARIQWKLVTESRDSIEQRLAQAIRANGELGQHYDRQLVQIKQLTDQVAELKKQLDAKPKE